MMDGWQRDMIDQLHQKRQTHGLIIDGAANRPGYRIKQHAKTADNAAADRARFKALDDAVDRRRDRLQIAYHDYETEMSEMWRHPVGLKVSDAGDPPDGDRVNPPIGFSSGDLVGKQVGDSCILRGSDDVGVFGVRGHVEQRGGRLVCVADRSSTDAADAARRKKIARYDPEGRSQGTWEEEEEDGDDDTGCRDARSVNDRSAVEAAYEDYSRDLENAWRNP